MSNNEFYIFEILKSKRGKENVYYNGYIYNFSHKNDSGSVWRCQSRKCHGRLKITESEKIVLQQHVHTSVTDIELLKVKNSYKEAALTTTYSNKELFLKTVLEKNINIDIQKKSVYKTISNVRKKQKGVIFGSDEVPFHLTVTNKNQYFVRFKSFNDNIKLIYTNEFLEYLCNSKIWIADGTFLSAPIEYFQTYVIYAFYLGKWIPAIYFFMKTKTEQEYILYFNEIKSLLNGKEPEFIIIDKEKAAYNAFQKIYTSSTVYHCLTHYSNNVHSLLLKFSLTNQFSENKQFRELVNMLKSLVFTPDSKYDAEIRKITNLVLSFKDFNITYFFEKFVSQYSVLKDGIYTKIKSFDAVYRLHHDIPLTTNVAEGYNSDLNRISKFQKTGLLNILQVLITRHSYVENSIYEILNSNAPKKSNFTEKKYDTLRMCISQYDFYVGVDFLKAIGYIYNWNK